MPTVNTGIDLQDGVVNLRFTLAACYDIAYDIFHALEKSCQTHWINHPDVWLSHEKVRIARMQQFFTLSGYGHLCEDMLQKLQDIVDKKQS
jgi:hypothetical protein